MVVSRWLVRIRRVCFCTVSLLFWGRGVVQTYQSVYQTLRERFLGANIEAAGDAWEFERSPSRFLSNLKDCVIIPDDNSPTYMR